MPEAACLLGWLTHRSLIVGLSPLALGRVFVPPLSAVENLERYATCTAGLWVAVGLDPSREGA